MKKNFFKKLSFVMALAMIISVIAPAAGAFAATGAHLNATKKYLYLAEENRPTSFDFNIISKPAGAAKFVWTSSNPDVASVESPSGVVTAEAKGTATIKVVIKSSTGKTLKSLSASVVVRDNIDTLKISNFTDKTVVTAGKEFDFDRTFTTFAGSTTATSSITRYAVDSDKATIDATTGKFTAKEAGEFNVTAYAFMSTYEYTKWLADKADSWVLAKDSVKVKVVNEISKVDQVNATTAKVTFASPVTDTVANYTVSTLVTATSTKIKQTIKKVTLSDDKMVATVEMYAPFVAGTTYVVDYADIAVGGTFVGASAKLADVASIAVTTTTLVADATPHDVVVGLYNAAGVELSSIDASLLNYVTMTSASEKVYASAKTLTFFTVGDSTAVTATFHTYTYNADGTEKGVLTATGTVTGVAAAAAASVSSVSAYTIVKGVAPDFSKANTVIAAEDNGYTFYAQAVKTDGKNFENSYAPATNTAWRFSSSDSNVLIVASNGTLYPVRNGNANVLVEYCANTLAVPQVWTVIGAPSVTVSAKRVATTLNLSAYAVSLSNTNLFVDSANVTIEVKDQYNAVMPLADVSVAENVNQNGTHKPIDTSLVGATDSSITFSGAAAVAGQRTDKGTYTYAVKANGLTKYVVVNVLEPSALTSTTYQLSVGTSYDEKITSTTAADITADVAVIGYAANGVAVEKLENSALAGLGLTVKAYKTTGAEDNSLLTAGGVGAAAYSVTLVDLSGTPSTKLPVGTYTFRLYKSTTVSGVTVTQLVDTKTFTVTDTQPQATATLKSLVATSGTSVATALLECFDVYSSAGVKASSMTGITYDIIGADASGTQVFVKNINVTETIGSGTVTTVIPVNTLITLK